MGDRIPAAVIRELAEQAELRWMLHTGTEILQLGRTQRLASDPQYDALIARDGFCRWPGCQIPAAWCQADHLIDWHPDGLTDIDLLALWCKHHHHVRHRNGTIIHGDANNLTLELPDGTRIACPPKGIAGGQRRQPGPAPRRADPTATEHRHTLRHPPRPHDLATHTTRTLRRRLTSIDRSQPSQDGDGLSCERPERGSVTTNRAPPPGRSTHTAAPPWCSANSRTRNNPIPEPGRSVRWPRT